MYYDLLKKYLNSIKNFNQNTINKKLLTSVVVEEIKKQKEIIFISFNNNK